MPALWPKFIPELASTLISQDFKKPGGAVISYDPPKYGSNNMLGETVAGQQSIIGGGLSKVGNPANAALATNPATMVNSINTNPLSGRYDFGKQVAQHYLDAVKGSPKAQTPFGAFHTNNPAAELILKEGYGIAFERLLREGDIPLFDQFDEDGNLIEMGKESHPAYADFCPTEEETKGPDLEALAAENVAAFDDFTKTKRTEYDLYKFKFYQFPCLSGKETQEELEVIFASRILMGYEFMTSANARWEYFVWACHLGKENYNAGGSGFNNSGQYKNISARVRNDIEDAGYDYKSLADKVSKYVKDGIMAAHPKEENGVNFGLGTNSELKARIKRVATEAIQFPTLEDESGTDITPDFCPINQYKLQVPYDFEHDPPLYESAKPKILTSNVVAAFTWYPNKRTNIGANSSTPYVTNNDDAKFANDRIKYDKSTNWVKQKYEELEFEKKWRKVPKAKLKAASRSSNAEAKFFEIDPKPEGTLFKFEYHKALCAKKAAAACEEDMAEVAHPWDPSGSTPGGKTYSGDPYMMMARVTIAYWYACIVKPFGPSPSALPALIPPPLTGIYIPIYYGSANRLANNLRRAWNTGKSFKVPGTQQPASMATATAVAGAYAMHLLEFKLLYLGGIPTPVGPVPMVGFVPVVF